MGMAKVERGRVAQEDEARKNLDRLRKPESLLGSVQFADRLKRAGDHFVATEASAEAPGDPIELWGRRIGRGLSAVGFVVLAIYLYLTYIR
jgi:hypothetical protein